MELTLEQLEDLCTSLIQQKIDINTEIKALKNEYDVASKLLDLIKITIDEVYKNKK